MPEYRPLEERFREKFRKVDSGCWIWEAGQHPDGYGLIWDGERSARAHRVSYEIQEGEIPEGAYILHECDNPPCVNPDHLYVGNQQDNMDDAKDSGSFDNQVSGEEHPDSKLTEEDVEEIRSKYENPEVSTYDLSEEYGVKPYHISRIIRGEAW